MCLFFWFSPFAHRTCKLFVFCFIITNILLFSVLFRIFSCFSTVFFQFNSTIRSAEQFAYKYLSNRKNLIWTTRNKRKLSLFVCRYHVYLCALCIQPCVNISPLILSKLFSTNTQICCINTLNRLSYIPHSSVD